MTNQDQSALWRHAIERCRANTDAAGGMRRWLGALPPRGVKHRIVWGHPVKANPAAFDPNSRIAELPAVCVWMADGSGDGDVDHLCEIARSLSDLRFEQPTEPAVPAVACVRDLLCDDSRGFKSFSLPPEIARDKSMVLGCALIDRRRLPIGCLMKAPFPLLAPPGGLRPDALVLPREFWAPEISEAWCAADAARADVHDFARLELQTL